MKLPNEIKHPQEIWIPTLIDVCKSKNIPFNQDHININKAFQDVKTIAPETNALMWDYFNKFEEYSLLFHSIKRGDGGALNEFCQLQNELKEKRHILYKTL
tara:strand:- start:104 stop:406 length:303 start_codon:yes stop_codon:yes gene_type:complete